MRDNLKKLILLQDCDNKIRSIDLRRKAVPIKIKKLEEIFNETSEVYKVKFDKLDSLKKERRTLEQGVQDLESKSEKSQIKLNSIKSNKEYTAALKEIEEINKEKEKNEDKILQIMEEIEALNKECDAIKEEQGELKKQFEDEKMEIEKEIIELDREAAELEKQRLEYHNAVDQELLKRYDFLRDRKAGVAIGAVTQGICQSCHMEIPPQKFNELKRCSTMMSCPHCNRLIYWSDDEFFVNLFNET